MAKQIKFSPGEFVRYLAGNCDSESLIEAFDERRFVTNVEEYLEVRSPWVKPSDKRGNRNLREVDHTDPDLSRKKVDVGMMSGRGDSWAMFLEAKWIYESRSIKKYVEEIIEDMFRLSLLVDKEKIAASGHRFLLLGGIGNLFSQVLNHENKLLKRLLGYPPKPIIQYLHYKNVNLTKLAAASTSREYFIKAEKGIGKSLPNTVRRRIAGRALSHIGETKNDKPIFIALWEIIPVHNVKYESFEK